MPTINARIRDGNTVRRHDNKYGPGITPHYLETNEVGVVEFDSTLFTADQARNWLTSHDYTTLSLAAGEEQADINDHKRYLAFELAPSNDIQEVDGGLLVPGVRLLAPGTWTDSTQKQPCRYTEHHLERYAQNWTSYSYWSRHSGGTPRDITDKIATIRNLRYDQGVIGDLFYHGQTTKSKDAISLIKAAAAGTIPWPYSSVEMMTRDKWILSEKLYEAQEITFLGAAMVDEGACRTCKIRNNEAADPTPEPEQEQVTEPAKELEQEMTDTKELEAAITAATAPLLEKIKALEAKIAPPEPAKVEIPKELTESITAIDERLKKLEEVPADPKTKATGIETPHDLGGAEFYIPVDRKAGTVGGV